MKQFQQQPADGPACTIQQPGCSLWLPCSLCLLGVHAVRHAPTPPEAAQGRALLKKLDASKDEWGAIYAISRKPAADLKGTRVNFIALNLLDVEVRILTC